MFFVFAINEPAERARLSKSIYRREAPSLAKKLQRDGAPDEDIPALLDQAVAALVEEDVKKLRPKPLAEFAMPSSAEDYVKVLRATPGFREASVKARVLTPPEMVRRSPATGSSRSMSSRTLTRQSSGTCRACSTVHALRRAAWTHSPTTRSP